MITHNPDKIEEHLEAQEADLTALEMSTQAATAFTTQSRTNHPLNTRQFPHTPAFPWFNATRQSNSPQSNQRPIFHCNNCGKPRHSSSKCYMPREASQVKHCGCLTKDSLTLTPRNHWAIQLHHQARPRQQHCQWNLHQPQWLTQAD